MTGFIDVKIDRVLWMFMDVSRDRVYRCQKTGYYGCKQGQGLIAVKGDRVLWMFMDESSDRVL